MFVGVYVGGRVGGLIGIYLMCMYGFPLFSVLLIKLTGQGQTEGEDVGFTLPLP